MTADRQLDAVRLRKPALWRRVTPYRLGFLLALALTLPWAVDVARAHMILCLRVTTDWRDRDGLRTRQVLTLENAGPLAIRVSLRANCLPAWLTKSRGARPWRACLPGSAWPD